VIRVSCESDWIVLEVSDNGVGIAEEEQAKVFDRFYRADSSSAHEMGGLGIGLHIVDKYVTLHGGKIKLESRVARGTTVTVFLPANLTSREVDKDDTWAENTGSR
jgi:signal transduction histidine kinase